MPAEPRLFDTMENDGICITTMIRNRIVAQPLSAIDNRSYLSMTTHRFQRLYPPAVPEAGQAHWLLFHGDDLLFADDLPALLEGTTLQPAQIGIDESFLLGTLDGRPVMFGALAADTAPPPGLRPSGLRAVLAQAD